MVQHQFNMLHTLPANKDSVDGDEDNKVERVPSALSKLTGPSYGLSDIIRSGTASGGEEQHQGPHSME